MVKRAKIIHSKSKQPKTVGAKKRLLPRLSLFFFDRPKLTAALFITIFTFGLLSYTTLLRREGFPTVDIPISSVSGAYFVNDPNRVDADIVQPIGAIVQTVPGVQSVRANSFANFFTMLIQYEEGTNAKAATATIKEQVEQAGLPTQASISYLVPYFGVLGPLSEPIDIAISFYAEDASYTQMEQKAQMFADELRQKNMSLVEDVFVVKQTEDAVNPQTGAVQTIQKSFDKYGKHQEYDGTIETVFYNSIIVGVKKVPGADVIALDDQVREAARDTIAQNAYDGYSAAVSASYAPEIKENIAELQRELIIALIAVLVIGGLVIAVRASIITVIAMITVIFAVLGLLLLYGYTLNVITLFALILSLALIVDDTIIMVEAIDAQRKKQKDQRKAIAEATHKISTAMLSATITAALSFAPLLFVTGILGSFIRALPVTIITALLISLVVALVFIPFLAKYLLLGKKSMGKDAVKEVAAGFEQKLAAYIAKPMLWARGSTKRLTSVGISALIVSFAFIGVGGYIATKVAFNIFPASKDANKILISMTFENGTTLQEAQDITAKAEAVIDTTIPEFFEQGSYYSLANERNATLYIDLLSYNERKETSSDIIALLQPALNDELPATEVKVSQIDAGPGVSPFTVTLQTDDTKKALVLADDIVRYLNELVVTRPSGEQARVANVIPANPAQVTRIDGDKRITISAEFDGTDTSALFVLAQSSIEQYYTPEKLAEFGFEPSVLVFDLGQESENQDSFAALLIAFPVLLFVMYILLALQFKSLLQPLLIFLAIPFSFFGISLSLYLSDNPFSFFAMLGFFALIGLSIKNTILLTDYANQSRSSGLGPVKAMVAALSERFRPLIATSITAVVALIPLSIISPFWQGLAILIIFGLLSSTFLVITVFPYYYLAGEFLRRKISRKYGVAITIGIIALLVALTILG